MRPTGVQSSRALRRAGLRLLVTPVPDGRQRHGQPTPSDSETFHSLRSSLGVRMSTNERQLGEHATWKAHASAAWNHELLDKAGTMHASFVEAANVASPTL